MQLALEEAESAIEVEESKVMRLQELIIFLLKSKCPSGLQVTAYFGSHSPFTISNYYS